MGTKRELTASKALESIIRLLRPMIDRDQEMAQGEAAEVINQ